MKVDRSVKLDIVSGGKHGGDEFDASERLDRIADELPSIDDSNLFRGR